MLTYCVIDVVTSSSHSHSHAPSESHPHADVDDKTAEKIRIQRLAMFLEAHFGEIELHMPQDGDEDAKQPQEPGEAEASREPALLVTVDEADAVITLGSLVRSPRSSA